MSDAGILERFWFVATPGLRLAVLRVLICSFALLWLIGFSPLLLSGLWFPSGRFEPVGVVTLLDAPLPPPLGLAIWLITVIAGVAALLGWRFRTVAPVFALGLLWVTSYRNSWGMIFHSENLLVMHALVLALLPASDAWSLDAARDPQLRARGRQRHPRYGWGPRLMATITVLTYVLAGVAKLRNAGFAWLDGEVLLGHVAWDNLRKIELGDLHSPLGAALSAYPAVFVPLAWSSLVLELGAPIALFGRWPARVWAAGMWAFHVGVLLIMAIGFVYPLTGIAFAPLFAVERPLVALGDRQRRRRPGSALAGLLPSGDSLHPRG
ncbi:MAG: HTTM domain-containing protein [Enhygromyxa sp.]